MSKKNVAILVDGEFFALTVKRALKLTGRPSAEQVGDHEPHRDLVEDSDFKRRHTPIL